MGPPFDPEDPDERRFHAQFAELRGRVVRSAGDLALRVKGRVAQADRPTPPLSEVLLGGLRELWNALARALRPPDGPV